MQSVQARQLLGIAGAIPFVLRYLETVDLGSSAHIGGGNSLDACAGDERRWTHRDDSTGIFSTEGDTETDS